MISQQDLNVHLVLMSFTASDIRTAQELIKAGRWARRARRTYEGRMGRFMRDECAWSMVHSSRLSYKRAERAAGAHLNTLIAYLPLDRAALLVACVEATNSPRQRRRTAI